MLAALAALAAAPAALAHPGHHEGGPEGLVHTLTEPDHLLALAAVGAAAALIVLGYRLLKARDASPARVPKVRGAQ